ncbi:MAG: GNAT family N-acetyltransferase [Candidatus Hermodarchaeota archaeon]
MKQNLKRITIEDIDDLTSIISDFVLTSKGKPQILLPKEQIHKALLANVINVFALYEQGDQAIGFVITRKAKTDPNHGYIFLLHIHSIYKNSDTLENYEYKLFDAAFAHLKSCSSINIEHQALSDALGDYIVSKGFRKIDRAEMSIGRSQIISLVEPFLPSEYSIISWETNMVSSVAKLIVDFNAKTMDGELFPYFREINRCENFIQELMNNPNTKFKDRHVKVLKQNNKFIGVCFLIITSSNTGSIPEFGISPIYQRKGLGRALLIHSLIQFFKTEPSIDSVTLDVTMDNIAALKLYNSLGFHHKRKYSVFILRRA